MARQEGELVLDAVPVGWGGVACPGDGADACIFGKAGGCVDGKTDTCAWGASRLAP